MSILRWSSTPTRMKLLAPSGSVFASGPARLYSSTISSSSLLSSSSSSSSAASLSPSPSPSSSPSRLFPSVSRSLSRSPTQHLQIRCNSSSGPSRPPPSRTKKKVEDQTLNQNGTSTEAGGKNEKGHLGSRLSSTWRNTKTVWYPIPIALGALVILGLNEYHKSTSPRSTSPDSVLVESTKDGQHTVSSRNGSPSGPWQVRVLGALPLRSMSQLWGWLNELQLPVSVRPAGFKLYAWIFGCNLNECEPEDLKEYDSLGTFFYRKLKDGVRPIDEGAAIVSPADGRVLHFGEVSGARVEQVKGMTYSLSALLGTSGASINDPHEVEYPTDSSKRIGEVVDDEDFAAINDIHYSLSSLLGEDQGQIRVHHDTKDKTPSTKPRDASTTDVEPLITKLEHESKVVAELGTSAFEKDGGSATAQSGHIKIKEGNKLYFMVIYLAPGDYHRFHSPAAWVVERRRHFTGDLFSVSPYIANRLQDLFVLNERVALLGRWRHGHFAMVPVGATNVGSIRINFDSALRTNHRHPEHPPQTFTEAVYTQASALLQGQPLVKGEEMGGFRLGSTIVLVLEGPADKFKWIAEAGDRVKVGQALAKIE